MELAGLEPAERGRHALERTQPRVLQLAVYLVDPQGVILGEESARGRVERRSRRRPGAISVVHGDSRFSLVQAVGRSFELREQTTVFNERRRLPGMAVRYRNGRTAAAQPEHRPGATRRRRGQSEEERPTV
jgi:hypothetical protein